MVAVRTGSAPLAPAGSFLASTDAKVCIYKLDDQGDVVYLAMIEGTSASVDGSSLSISAAATTTAVLLSGASEPIEATVLSAPDN